MESPVKGIHMPNQFRQSFLTLFIPLALLVILAAAYFFNQAIDDQKAILKADGSLNVVSGGRAVIPPILAIARSRDV